MTFDDSEGKHNHRDTFAKNNDLHESIKNLKIEDYAQILRD
jgi:hypothetical protein